MSFMDMLKEWLELRDTLQSKDSIWISGPIGGRYYGSRTEAFRRMGELEAEIDRRMRGEL